MFTFHSTSICDAQQVRELASKIWEPTYKDILPKEQLDYMFEMMYSEENIIKQMNNGNMFFITKESDKPVGYVSIEKKEEGVFIIQKLYALPEMHGKGSGRFMVEQAISYIKKDLLTANFEIELYVNRQNPAVEFYKHIGFEEIATRDHHIGNGYYMNDYIMRLSVVL